MDAKYIPAQFEQKMYRFWEDNNYFVAAVSKDKKPFSIILPPPNANADLHLGHAMYVYEDIMIRYFKIKGYETLWLSGADHAGFETQYVFEKQLKKQGKSRFDYDRQTLYKMIWDFVAENRGKMENQLRRLGFALDWSKLKFTLDEDIVKIVYKTFKKLYDEGLVYREARLVNYCTRCGTSFSDLEVKHVEQVDPLYYIKYGPFILATVRPETKFGDTAIAVNPRDRRYQKWIGKEIEVEGLLGKFKIGVIADAVIDSKFGTGVAKVTPAHDMKDFEIGSRHNLPMKQIIDFNGRLTELTGPYAGLRVKAAREKVAADLKARGLIDHIDEKYTHTVATCYKCGTVLEPLPLEQWFVKVKPLSEAAAGAIEKEKISFVPKRFKKTALQWLSNFHDWNISRQIVWGIRIPAWKCSDCHSWTVTDGKPADNCTKCSSTQITQDSDTFDTWFSSAQWPFATLQSLDKDFFDYFYPTSVMETGYDILPWWVCRMIMIGLYATGKIPFQTVYLHGLVRDKSGAKMSKSKGNVVNPMVMVEEYGADALRAALVFQAAEGADLSFTEDKLVGMRNFTNKIWNIGRFIYMNRDQKPSAHHSKQVEMTLASLENEFTSLNKKVAKNMDSYKFSTAFGALYEFIWHRFADYYLEELKPSVQSGNIKVLEDLEAVYLKCLVLLHPFIPFVTEAVWKEFKGEKESILCRNEPINQKN